MPAQTSVKSEMDTVQYRPLCPNIVTAVLLLYKLCTGFYPPDLCLSMCKEFIVHGTISYVVLKKETREDCCSEQVTCKTVVFRVFLNTFCRKSTLV